MKPPLTPRKAVSRPSHGADHERRNGADIETRAGKAQLERQTVNPIVLSGAPRGRSLAHAGALQRADALAQHQRADHAEKDHVGQRDEEAGLSRLAQEFEQEDACERADDTAGNQDRAHMEVDIAPAPLGKRAPDRGGDHLIGAGRDRDRGRDAGEHQERGQEEAAAHPEHAGEKAHCRAESQHHQKVHRDFGNGQVNLEHRGRRKREDRIERTEKPEFGLPDHPRHAVFGNLRA